MTSSAYPYAPLRLPQVRALLFAAAFSTLASSSLAVVIGYWVYRLSRGPLAIGLLGLMGRLRRGRARAGRLRV